MTSNLRNSRQNYEESESKENKSDGHSSDGDCNSSLKLLRREFHNSLDLNRLIVDSTLIEFDEPCKLPIKSENNVGNEIKGGSLKQETQKRDLTELETIDHQQDTNNMDLELKLSPPKVIISKGESSKSSSKIFSQENRASLSSTNSSNYEDISGSKCKVNKASPSLVLMGCTHCYLYVMVSEAEPECPKCKTCVLLDIFRANPSKKCKRA